VARAALEEQQARQAGVSLADLDHLSGIHLDASPSRVGVVERDVENVLGAEQVTLAVRTGSHPGILPSGARLAGNDHGPVVISLFLGEFAWETGNDHGSVVISHR